MSQNAVEEILSGVDINALAAQLGTDQTTARQAAETAIPTLLGSLQANTADPEGQQKLLGALGQHTTPITDVNTVDTDDGRKILGHMFADDPQRLQGLSGHNGDLLSKLLPILAPIVMNWLAQRVLGSRGQAGTNQAGTNQGEGGLGGLLGGILGGAGGSAGGGGLGDILGQVLGGATGGPGGGFPGQSPPPGGQQQRQPGSGDQLGGLLGQILGR